MCLHVCTGQIVVILLQGKFTLILKVGTWEVLVQYFPHPILQSMTKHRMWLGLWLDTARTDGKQALTSSFSAGTGVLLHNSDVSFP